MHYNKLLLLIKFSGRYLHDIFLYTVFMAEVFSCAALWYHYVKDHERNFKWMRLKN